MWSIGPPTPVQICQVEQEFNAVLDLYRETKPRRVLEIGTQTGGTLYHWLTNAEPGAVIVTVDIVDHNVPVEAWCPDGIEGHPLIGDSHDPKTVEQVEAHGPYEWLFIDGSHIYEDVREDWDLYCPMLAPNATALLHDISLQRDYPETNQTAGVWKLWREIQAKGYVTQELRAHPTEYGIGLVFFDERHAEKPHP